ncbi:MAG: ABC transporter permease [Lachnospiraceae bacterium]|jgi:peptide/nickel transport system permease protein|nr:ABC transporter permease [Lachnospiraceae bacterium]
MGRYILHRLLLTILVVLGAAVVIFTIMHFVPGDPVEILLGNDATLEQYAAKRSELGLDKPFLIQLWNFMYKAFLRLDLGASWTRSTPVLAGMLERLPRTFLLGILSIILTTVVAIPIGVNAAIHQNGLQDRGLIVAAMVFISVPEFWLALLLIILFSLKLGWLPSFGIESWKSYILPVVSGSMASICTLARQTRASVLDVVHADYITTARSKGMVERDVIYGHMLPNALIPIITMIGMSFTACVGGTVVMEQIFSFPGVGLYLSDAISRRDYPVIRGCVVVMAAFTAILMLFVDLAYGYVDPRIKAQYISSSAKKGKVNEKRHRRPGPKHHSGHGNESQ